MGVRLVVIPRKTVSWDEFVSTHPPYSIAIDGYCSGVTRMSDDGLHLNINHHEDCDRLATRSSCAQALMRVKMGLFDAFSVGDKRRAQLYANDCDQDVTWATYVLMHPDHVDRTRLKALVQLEDLLDASAGLYPLKKRWHLLKKLLWISEPYTDARADHSLFTMEAEEMTALIIKMHHRIRSTLYGRGEEIEPDTSFEVIAEFPRWSFIREVGKHARIGVAQKGIKAFVSLLDCNKKVCRYVIMRRSRHIGWFPLERIRDRLNEAEGIAADAPDRWGGSCDNVIGSPRQKGSSLQPREVLSIVQSVVETAA